MSDEKNILNLSDLPEYLAEKHGLDFDYYTLSRLNSVGMGPPFTKRGTFNEYEREKVDEWAEARKGNGPEQATA